MKRVKRVLKILLYPFLPIIYFLKDSRPTVRSLSIWKTIYVNVRCLPFRQARYLPIYIYKGIKIYKLGNISLDTEQIKRGMIVVGLYDYKSNGYGKLYNAGNIIFRGPTVIGGGFIIENLGTMIFKGYGRVGEGVTFLIRNRFEMGEYSALGFRSFCMDSDDHYTISTETLTIHRNRKPIIIGKRNWIANSTVIKKGTITPDYTIVASANSLLSKDYSDIEPYSVLGGVPAKKIGSGIRRVYNLKEECNLIKFFEDNPDVDIYTPDITKEDLDNYCLLNFPNY